MTSPPFEEVELNKKHEEILGKRTVLLQQMESRYEQQKSKRRQQVKLSQAAHERNSQLLQDLQKMENRLRTRKLPHPDILNLETRYWASVEEKIPEWERFLLGKGPHPSSDPSRTPKQQKQKTTPRDHAPTQDGALPPRPILKRVK
ncbi:centrosomal protein 15 isoform X1 [Oncorhynchus nerka]|uniref:centrosomal protein 15 isoform X1 n=2 Tax=Oncorhynchus nerka TaxID=8023 RepID=UPI0011310D72|nr:uncharacterized protein C3orf14 homolog isoform X1 [Oncorhynchus nerka]